MGQQSSRLSFDYVWDNWAESVWPPENLDGNDLETRVGKIVHNFQLQRQWPEESYNSITEIEQLFHIYQTWKTLNIPSETIDQRYEWLLLYTLGKMCVWFKPNNSTLVANILLCLLHCDRYSDWVFEVAFHELRNPYVDVNTEEGARASIVLYFLHHANNVGMMIGNYRFVDTFSDILSRWVFPLRPMFDETLARSKLLICILRYGAFMCKPPDGTEPVGIPIHLLELMDIFVYKIHKIIGTGNEIDESRLLGSENSNLKDILLCLKLLSLIIPQMRLSYFDHQMYLYNRNQIFTSGAYIQWLFESNVVSDLGNCSCQPSRLAHLCRCRVRFQLWQNWKLPHGIELLLLPSSLKEYLNLKE